MKKILVMIGLISFWVNASYAQNTWTQKADFGGNARFGAVSFSIGNKGYIGTGSTGGGLGFMKNDFWEYDPNTNTWSQKADFEGSARNNGVGFSIGDKGYIGTGRSLSTENSDFWEYDPVTNTWTQKANFGGGVRIAAIGFSIGGKGYLGIGNQNNIRQNDFWEYNPLTDAWTQKTNFGGTGRTDATGFSVGNKGYVGTGFDNSGRQSDFWEYNPQTNTWTQKANFGGGIRSHACGLNIGNKGYMGSGFDNSSTYNDFWEYDPQTDAWMQMANLGGLARGDAAGFSIGTKGYIGTGSTIQGGGTLSNDFWEYTPALLPPTITSFTPSSGSVGTSVTITGTNFNATPDNNIVYFGALKATVTSGSATSLTVTAPAGAAYQPISVLDIVTGLTAYSSKPFIITFTNPFGTGIPANFYKAKVDFITGTNPRSVANGDVDGDGKPDLVVANTNSNTISVMRNTSTSGSISASSFASKVDFSTGTGPISVAIGDIDGDGKPDLVVANFNSATISFMRNTSTSGSISASSFASKVDFATGTGPISVAIGDVDGDGKPDLMTANYQSNSISVLRNTAVSGSIIASSFAAKVDFTTGNNPFPVAIGDVDGDGKPDLVVANQNSNTLSILRNTSTSGSINASSFTSKVDFATGTNPIFVAIGDVDGDGKPDLVVANNFSNTLSILRNTSTSGSISASSFAAKVDFATGNSPISVAIGDIDGDGKPEIAAANYGSNTVSVFQIAIPTTTSVISSLNPSIVGQNVTFTATVAAASGTPTGTVTFFDGATNLGSRTLSGTTATYNTSALTAGSHNITATYNGDANYASSTSSVLTQVVTATITSSVNTNTFCAGSSFNIDYIATGTYNVGNIFTAQLSNASGSFTATTPVDIGNVAATASGTINATIPATTPAGIGYRIRVVSSNPVVTGSDNGSDITINAQLVFYRDADNDGYGNLLDTVHRCSAPAGYITDNTDCDDTQKLYADNDGDTYGSTTLVACGGVTNNTDCNDADATVHAPLTYYADNDGDGFGDANNTTSACQSTPPAGYVSDNTDCNDDDASVHTLITYYADVDQDGFGDPGNTKTVCSSIPPKGYVTNSSDCDDSKLLYTDADGDGYGAGDPVGCGIANNTDCNDADASVHDPITYYKDNDGDGFGDLNNTTSVCSSTPPAGYVTNSLDCNDNKLLYADKDGDGYGAGDPVACGVANNTDCNDNDASVHTSITYYKDNDGDGFGDLNTTTVVCSSTPPQGYVANHSDCNDNDAAVHTSITYYKDVDGDGFGDVNTTIQACSSTSPQGYVANSSDCNDSKLLYADNDGDGFGAGNPVACGVADNTDCNDANAGVHAPITYYKDNDGDGFGNVNITTTACSSTPPSGYVANSTDCNDADNSIYPGAPELCDSKDNNCNGTTDEGCSITLPKITINDVAVNEGNSGTKNINFTVTLSKKSTQTVQVNYATANNTATALSDYTAKSGTLSLAPGVKTKTISVVIKGDKVKEKDETFKVVLSKVVNAAIADSIGIGTIINDDGVKSSRLPENDESSSTRSFMVLPNPANSIINVALSGYKGSVTLQLMDMLGKVLKEYKVQAGYVKYAQQQVDVSGVAGGVYLIIALDENGNRQAKKVIVAH